MDLRNLQAAGGLMAALVVGACASSAPVQQVGLAATRFNAGEIGQALLVPRAQETDVVVKVSGVPDMVTRPVHLYAYIYSGSCGSLGRQPAYPLTRQVLATREPDGFLSLRSTAAVPWDQLQAAAHALVVRSAPADEGQVLFCGNLRAG